MITNRCILSIVGKVLLAVLIYASHAHADIFVIKNRDGSVTFTTKKPDALTPAEVFKPKGVAFSVYSIRPLYGRKLYKNRFEDSIVAASRLRGVEPSLIKAVIHAESGFDPHARSPKGAMGLMQLMPGTARLVGVRNPYDSHENILGGTTYLADMIARYQGDLRKALAAYNAGPLNVDTYRGIPPFKETQQYVRKVLDLHQAYRTKTG